MIDKLPAETQQPMWHVLFANEGPFIRVTLTFERLLPDGRSIQFDEDPEPVLDLTSDQDERLLLDGFLVLPPDGMQLSCALHRLRDWIVWEWTEFQHIPAAYNRQVVRSAFTGRLFNTDSSIDILFAGGDAAAHTRDRIVRAASFVEREIAQKPDGMREAALIQVLAVYPALVYTQNTEIYLLGRQPDLSLAEVRAALTSTATRYGLALPPSCEATL